MYRKKIYDRYLSSTSMSQEEMEAIFDSASELHPAIMTSIPESKSSAILDLGCGFGSFLNQLRKKGYTDLTGVEVGPEQAEFLRQKEIEIYQADIFDFLASNKRQFDVIFLLDVLEHFKKDEIFELIPELLECLKHGGLLVIRVPNGEAIFKGSVMYGDFTHETFFTGRSLAQVFSAFSVSEANVYDASFFSSSMKGRLRKTLFTIVVAVYKGLLSLDNPESVKTFRPSQNIIGVFKK